MLPPANASVMGFQQSAGRSRREYGWLLALGHCIACEGVSSLMRRRDYTYSGAMLACGRLPSRLIWKALMMSVIPWSKAQIPAKISR